MSEAYYTAVSYVEHAITLNKSKFIAFFFPCTSESGFKEQLQTIKSKHPKATHHCYAYLFSNPTLERANDDGEPSGSAGFPILGQLKSHRLINVACVVVRYYGGTKLGVSGLIAAYKKVSLECITLGEVIPFFESISIRLTGDFTSLMQCLSFCKQQGWVTTLSAFDGEDNIVLHVNKSDKKIVEEKLSVFSNISAYVLQ